MVVSDAEVGAPGTPEGVIVNSPVCALPDGVEMVIRMTAEVVPVGVPEITPVAVLMLRPAGKVPELTENVLVPDPPTATMLNE